MALLASASSSGKEFKPVPSGAHIGRCFKIIDLGTQTQEWQGKARKARKVLISWELFGEDEEGVPLILDDGRPLSVSKRYTLSLSEKSSLRADLEAWRGRQFTEDELSGFDLKKLLGIYGMLTITHSTKDGKTYSNVAGISPIPKAMRDHRPAPVNENQYFDTSEPDMTLFETFSDKLKETIKSCAEWQSASETAKKNRGSQMEEMDSDTPW